MNGIQIFRNEAFGEVRVTEVDRQPMFVASDVAKALGYANPAKAVIDHCKGVSILETPTNGGIQQVKYIPEGDVYRLVMRSKLPAAEQFQDWVCEEILPSIRRTGGYIAAKENDTPELIMARALMVAKETIERAQNRIRSLENENAANAPKVLFADAVATSDRSCLVAELAKILQQNGVKIGQNRLFEWLRDKGYLGTKGDYYNQPPQRAMEMGLFEIKKTSITKPDGVVLVTATTKVTGKGQIYFVNKFLKGQGAA